MASIFKPSRVISVAIFLAAGAWIVSGELTPANVETPPPEESVEDPASTTQKVGVALATPEFHQRQIALSCLTEADNSSVAVARGVGVIVELNVKRGSTVRADDVIATLSDEGRVAAVKQAEALLAQRKAEYDANKALIDRGSAPKNDLPALEAAVASAEATLATAEAMADRSIVRSPIDGVVDEVPVQVGQAVQASTLIAEIIDPDPMLAVGAVSERERGYIKDGQSAEIRFIDGQTVEGTISFVGLSADEATRTYPVEARMDNPDALIPDGVTCDMEVTTDPVEAAAVNRSALIFSDAGELGIRIVDDEGRARFKAVTIVDDSRESVWVSGVDKATQVIVVGQYFVQDGDVVEAVSIVAEAEPES